MARERRETIPPRWWPLVAGLPVVVGALWLWWAAQGGVAGVLVGVLPGTLLLATGVSNLLWSGDTRIFQFMALGALAGAVLSLPTLFLTGPVVGALLAGSAACFVATGYLSVDREHIPPEVPRPHMDAKLAARAAVDEASVAGLIFTTWPLAVGRRAERIGRELDEALELFEEKGWLAEPASYHRKPPPVEEMGRGGLTHSEPNFEHLTFESGYEPWPEEPGREHWLSYEANRTAHAWALRHPGGPRPWLVCVHGIRVGSPRVNLGHFQPDYLHRELGLNLLFPVLPLHGPRRTGVISGDRVLSGEVMGTLHAASQAVWDIWRLTSWLREPGQDAPAVGVLGHSLGGYTTALLCGLEEGLDCTVAGNPAVNPSYLFWRNALSLTTHYLRSGGVTEERIGMLLRVISPLSLTPQVPKRGRAVLGGVADRIVPPSEPVSLWRHWDRPRIAWYQGTHTEFFNPPEARAVLEDALSEAGMLPEEG